MVKVVSGWPERTEKCRSIEIYNKYTNSAFVGGCYLHVNNNLQKKLLFTYLNQFIFSIRVIINTFQHTPDQ
jgi:hypothetical protein